MGDEPTGDYSGSVDGRYPSGKPTTGTSAPALQLQVLPELAQDTHDIEPIDGGSPGGDVCVDEAARIKEGEDHLLAVAGLHLCLQWARLAPESPLFAHSFGLRCIVQNHGLVHGDKVVRHGEPTVLDGGDEFVADSHALLFLPFRQQNGRSARQLLLQAQITF